MSDEGEENLVPPLSDVGSRSDQTRTESVESDGWRKMFEMQNANMRALIEALQSPKASYKVDLPEFNPEKTDTDARSWSATADLCFAEKPLSGGQLVVALSKALKGAASTWLSQIAYHGMTWNEFKVLFTTRFISSETLAGTLVNLHGDKPNEKESLAAYASRLITSLSNQWKDSSKDQIAIATVLAHVSQFDTRLQRLAFTTNITTREKLQQELHAFSHLKRKASTLSEPSSASDIKRAKISTIKCFLCGKLGHKKSECRSYKPNDNKGRHVAYPASTQTAEKPAAKPLVCYKCGKPGHIAIRCMSGSSQAAGSGSGGGSASGSAHSERRVDVCVVQTPTGTMEHKGELFSFSFDSGAECSLVKEKVAAKLCGKRFNSVVSMTGIGQTRVLSTEQISCCVTINDHPLELLLHVLPDSCLQSDIMIGREILSLGFVANMTDTVFSLSKSVNSISKNDKIQPDLNAIKTDVVGRDKLELLQTLNRFSEFFITGMPTTRVNTGELQIRLVDPNRTVQRRPYRMSMEERSVVRDRVRELLDANIIRPSCSPFASPALLVKKQDGSDRMVIDYRELNNNTVSDRYPLPLISDQIARLNGANYFSQLDCASGFHLIPVHEESIERTAFITNEAQYEFLTMPFGLKNAISVFQRAIVNALGDLANDYVIVYVDDVLIVSPDVEQGLLRLNTVLEVLTKAGFSLNLKKCSFLKTKVVFLGFEVEAGQIRPNRRKVEALTALPPPQTVTQLRQFIGLSSYFRQFVQNFSRIMASLYRLTSLKGDLTWKPEHEEVRQKIISILTNDPVLMIFDPQYPVELHTDASSLGYGAILFQVVDGKRHVVAFFSKRTSPAESKYHSYELETLAVVNSVKHFRQFLHGRKFTVVTDCNSLKSSQTKIELTPRAHRWWAFLQLFDFVVVYREGKRMSHVDFFSRNLVPSDPPVVSVPCIEQKRIEVTELSPNWLQAEQQRDEEISKIVVEVESGQMNEELAKTYVLRSGVLYRKIQRNGRTKCLPYLPRSLRWSVINNVHDSLVHLGADKTREKLFDFYWFPGMTQYVKKFVDSCVTCKVAKSHSGKVQAELHPIPKVTIPWHTVHIDATGKLSGKNDSKEYVFVLIDAFTKYVLLYHTSNIDSRSSIRAVNQSVALFGAPTRIIADQGRCFASREFGEFCDSKNIKLHLIATGSSRANGQVERVMSVLKSMLTAVETNENRSWQDAIGDVQLAINCTMNRVTKASPLELLIGKVARPLSLMCSDVETEVDIDNIRETASNNIQRSAVYEKERFDSTKAKVSSFSIGDFVLLANEERNQTKLDPKFKGPFKVIEVLEGDRYVLKALNCKRTYKYAHDRLRPMPVGHVPDEVDSSSDQDEEVFYGW